MRLYLYEGRYFDLKNHLESSNHNKTEIDTLKKRADKGAFLCPYCNETLILKIGNDELKTQEKINPDLQVDFGFILKSSKKMEVLSGHYT